MLLSHQSCSTLCDHMDCSMPGFHVPHHLLKFVQVQVHCIGDAIKSSHPLMSLSPSSIFPQHQGLFQSVSCLHQMTKYWSFSFSISPSKEYSGLISLKTDWFDLAVQGTLRSLLQHHSLKAAILWCSAYFMLPVLTTVPSHWEDHRLDYMDVCQQSNASAFQHAL